MIALKGLNSTKMWLVSHLIAYCSSWFSSASHNCQQKHNMSKKNPTLPLSEPWLSVLVWCGAWWWLDGWCSPRGRHGDVLLLEVLLPVCCEVVTCRLSIAPNLEKKLIWKFRRVEHQPNTIRNDVREVVENLTIDYRTYI